MANEDFFRKINADMDQLEAAFKSQAQLAALFYNTLRENKVPDEHAAVLTWQFHRTVLWKPSPPPPEDI